MGAQALTRVYAARSLICKELPPNVRRGAFSLYGFDLDRKFMENANLPTGY